MDKASYVVLTPYIGGRYPAHLKCMLRLFADGVSLIEIDGCPYIDMAEALLVEQALESTSAEVLMFIEHDMIFNPADVEKIIQHLLDSDYDALGALYPLKKFNGQMMAGKLDVPAGNHSVDFYVPGTHPALFLGFGFTAIRRSVFERFHEFMPLVECPSVGRAVHPYFIHDISSIPDKDGPMLYNGNDVSFYNRMRRYGMRVGADLEIKVQHIGGYTYSLEDIGHTPPKYERLTVNFKE